MRWTDLTEERAKHADEAEKVILRILQRELGRGASLRRYQRFGEYCLSWTREDLGKSIATGTNEIELSLFDEENETTHDMLWNSQFGFDWASNGEIDYARKTPLCKALEKVSQGVVDYLWEQSHQISA